jgi:hypothetical protein
MMSKKLDVSMSERFKGGQFTERTRGETHPALTPGTFAMVEMKANGSLGQVDHARCSLGHIQVIFSMEGDSHCPGVVRNATAGQKVIFVESKQVVPVGTDLTIRLTTVYRALAEWGVVEGTVVWQCPFEDIFKNGKGFGLYLRGGWPQLPEPLEAEGLRGTA